MAAVVYGPALPLSHGDLSDVSSPRSTAASSESPSTATRLYFSVRVMGSPTEQEGDVVPKIEEVEEEEDTLEETKPLPSPPEEEESSPNTDQTLIKRPRGRPRKHPKEPQSAVTKSLKGRSKTGCITCRRRKKKCDETRPECTTHAKHLFKFSTFEHPSLTLLSRHALSKEQRPL
jgi:hypothetical protein